MTVVTQQAAPDILIIDAEHAIHRAYHAYERLHTSVGVLSGAFYGFLAIVQHQVENLVPGSVAIVWGHPKSGEQRKKDCPVYKAGRRHDPRLFKQMNDLQSFLACMGWWQLYNDEGWEADDVIATLVHQYENDYGIIILSGDHDFFQLINENVRCLRPGLGKLSDKMYDHAAILTEYDGVPPEQLADLYSMTGDDTDNIQGVPGIGKATAAKILVNNGPIKQWINSMDKLFIAKRFKEIFPQYQRLLFQNKKLVSLKNTKVTLREIPAKIDVDAARLILDKYEIKKFTVDNFLMTQA